MKDTKGTQDPDLGLLSSTGGSGSVGTGEEEEEENMMLVPRTTAASSSGEANAAVRSRRAELQQEQQPEPSARTSSITTETRTIGTQTDNDNDEEDGYPIEPRVVDSSTRYHDPRVAQARERILLEEKKNIKAKEFGDDDFQARDETKRLQHQEKSDLSRRQSEGLLQPPLHDSHGNLSVPRDSCKSSVGNVDTEAPSESWRSATTSTSDQEANNSKKMGKDELEDDENAAIIVPTIQEDEGGTQQPSNNNHDEDDAPTPGAVAVQGRAFGQLPAWGRHRAAAQPTTAASRESPVRSPTLRSLLGSVRAVSRSSHNSNDATSSVPQAEQVHDATLVVYPESIATPGDLARQERASKRQKRCCYGAVAFLVVAALALGVAFGFGLGQSTKEGGGGDDACDGFESQTNPTFIMQCMCGEESEDDAPLEDVPPEVEQKFQELRKRLGLNETTSNDPLAACENPNLALWWLANDTVARAANGDGGGWMMGNNTNGNAMAKNNTNATCPATPAQFLMQRYVLALVYLSMGGSNWPRQNGWLSSNKTCDWEGVGCSFGEDQNVVIRLRLNNQNATGTIPIELGRLCALRELDLNSNELSGPVPGDLLMNMKYLRSINLRANFLTGVIPDIISAEDRKYVKESLENINMTDEIEIEDFPEEVKSLLNETVGRKGPFFSMDFSKNNFTGTFPLGFGLLTTLREVRADGNQLKGDPTPPLTISLFKDIEVISFQDNELAGEIPTRLGLLTRLEHLDLSRNRMTGPLVTEIGNLEELTNLNLGFNLFTGTVPEEYANLQRLVEFDLRSPDLEGPVPASVCTSLVLLDPGIWVNCSDVELLGGCGCCQCNPEVDRTGMRGRGPPSGRFLRWAP